MFVHWQFCYVPHKFRKPQRSLLLRFLIFKHSNIALYIRYTKTYLWFLCSCQELFIRFVIGGVRNVFSFLLHVMWDITCRIANWTSKICPIYLNISYIKKVFKARQTYRLKFSFANTQISGYNTATQNRVRRSWNTRQKHLNDTTIYTVAK